MYNKIVSRLKLLQKETLFATIGLCLFFFSVPWIRSIFPTASTVDRGGEFHVMLSGLMPYASAFALTVATLAICFKTYKNYALHNDDDEDPKNAKASFREDWEKLAPKERIFCFVGSFFIILSLAIYCLTPTAIIVQ